jgi:hypothetical protein
METDKMSPPIEPYNFKSMQLGDIKNALQENLKEFFGIVQVEVTECPDFSAPPFNLAAEGFGQGEITILDVGGPPFMIPVLDRSKVYDMAKLVPAVTGEKNFPQGWYINGAAAGPWPSVGTNSEMIVNLKIGKDKKIEKNRSKIVTTWTEGDKKDFAMKHLPFDETRFALLGNMMVSSGIRGQVLKITCSKRAESAPSFTMSIRKALAQQFGEEPIGLGGLFMIRNSASKIHVMQDFSKTPLITEQEVHDWLHYFPMGPPMLFQSVLVSADPGLDLRIEHSHGWSLDGKNEGGHYHYDLSPDTVEYHGYYAVAHKIYRVDRPISSHQLGRY